MVVYDAFKELATRLSIALFLSHDMGQEDAKSVSELMTTHWRGMMSVPLPFTIPGLWRSGYSKALEAKVEFFVICCLSFYCTNIVGEVINDNI